MFDDAYVGDLFRKVIERGVLVNPRRGEPEEEFGREKTGGQRALKWRMDVAGRSVDIAIVLGRSFPIALPKVFVRPWDALGFIPHVDLDGFVCYSATEGLLLDASRPVEIVEHAIQAAHKTLTDGVTGSNLADFTDELEAYWSKLQGVRTYQSVLDPSGDVRTVVVATRKRDQGVVASDLGALQAFYNASRLPPNYETLDALYIPLLGGRVIIPPRIGAPMWSAQELRAQVWPNLSGANVAVLSSLITRRRTKDTVVLSVPRPSGGETMVAFRATGMRNGHVLGTNGTAEVLVPITLDRWDRSYLVPRGGGDSSLNVKHVLLVGIGAVGGRVGFELVRSGVLRLTLVDDDKLEPENTFRHVLGRQFWGQAKVTAMRKAIEDDLPYVRVTPFEASLQEILAAEGPSSSQLNCDLVISATGNHGAELALNRVLRAMPKAPPCIFTWLEPLGIGGHALLMSAGTPGCLECLYCEPNGSRRSHNRLSFADRDQEFRRALTGCGSLHMPFGSLDAARTADLATRMAVDVLRGVGLERPRVASWKGDAREFTAAGFRLTPRFELSEELRWAQAEQFAVTCCPVCGTGSGRT